MGPLNILTGGPRPCNFEPWHLLIKVANDEPTHTTHKEMQMYTLVCWSKLQKNVEITALFCIHVIKSVR